MMHQVSVDPGPPRRVTVEPHRRAAVLVAGLMIVWGAGLAVLALAGQIALDAKSFIMLGVSLIAPLLMLAMAAGRTIQLEGEQLFLSGPFGAGGTFFDASDGSAVLTRLTSYGQLSYRLTWVSADGFEATPIGSGLV